MVHWDPIAAKEPERQEGLRRLQGLVDDGTLTPAQAEHVRITAGCYLGQDAVEYLERTLAYVGRAFRIVRQQRQHEAEARRLLRERWEDSDGQRDDKPDILAQRTGHSIPATGSSVAQGAFLPW